MHRGLDIGWGALLLRCPGIPDMAWGAWHGEMTWVVMIGAPSALPMPTPQAPRITHRLLIQSPRSLVATATCKQCVPITCCHSHSYMQAGCTTTCCYSHSTCSRVCRLPVATATATCKQGVPTTCCYSHSTCSRVCRITCCLQPQHMQQSVPTTSCYSYRSPHLLHQPPVCRTRTWQRKIFRPPATAVHNSPTTAVARS